MAAGLDRKNWDVPKTIAMGAPEAGTGVTPGLLYKALAEHHFDVLAENLRTAPAEEPPPHEERPAREEPPVPIVERARIPRNAPCPCGSGKKYKKCHGRPEAQQTADR